MASPNSGYYYHPSGSQAQQQPQATWSGQYRPPSGPPPPQSQPWPGNYPSNCQAQQQPQGQAWFTQQRPSQPQSWSTGDYPPTYPSQQQPQTSWSAQRPPPQPQSWPSSSSGSSSSNQEIVFTDEDADHLFNHSLSVPPRYSLAPLAAPIVIPRESSAFDAPFMRAYAPDAVASGINRDDWLAFLDGFNMAATTSPPLRVVNTVGQVLGFVYVCSCKSERKMKEHAHHYLLLARTIGLRSPVQVSRP
jgi:hypothetical protein